MYTVLLIDDSKTFLNILHTVLKMSARVLGQAQNAQDGIKLYKELKPDIVLLDITMPNISGKECLKMIKDFDQTAKVIMVTSISDDNTVKECLDLGAKGFIKKDLVSLKNTSVRSPLVEAIEKALSKSA